MVIFHSYVNVYQRVNPKKHRGNDMIHQEQETPWSVQYDSLEITRIGELVAYA